MIAFPFCKINLGLHVINKRPDGYHNIETCFYPVPWKDVLEIIPSSTTQLFLTGNKIEGDQRSNLCLKAYELLKKDFPIGPVDIHLHKIIPTGAGLGGGSSDGAHALSILDSLFALNLSNEKLSEYALQLGSDCPFFMTRSPMIGTSRGEVMDKSPVNLSGLNVTIVNPDVHVSTSEAYSGIAPKKPDQPLTEILQRPIAEWKSCLKNDFEETVFGKHPVIVEIKNSLYARGAAYASMSGSGSSVFGLYEKEPEFENEFRGMNVWSSVLGNPSGLR
jgi:4-diphosphocytidyl-2-C-methyl-D-erythritol kinase